MCGKVSHGTWFYTRLLAQLFHTFSPCDFRLSIMGHFDHFLQCAFADEIDICAVSTGSLWINTVHLYFSLFLVVCCTMPTKKSESISDLLSSHSHTWAVFLLSFKRLGLPRFALVQPLSLVRRLSPYDFSLDPVLLLDFQFWALQHLSWCQTASHFQQLYSQDIFRIYVCRLHTKHIFYRVHWLCWRCYLPAPFGHFISTIHVVVVEISAK